MWDQGDFEGWSITDYTDPFDERSIVNDRISLLDLGMDVIRLIASFDGEVLFNLRKLNKTLNGNLKNMSLKVDNFFNKYTLCNNKIDGKVALFTDGFPSQEVFYKNGVETSRRGLSRRGKTIFLHKKYPRDILYIFGAWGRKLRIRTKINETDFFLEEFINEPGFYKVTPKGKIPYNKNLMSLELGPRGL